MRYLIVVLLLLLPGCVSDAGYERLNAFSASLTREAVPEDSPLYNAVEVGEILGGRRDSDSYTGAGGMIATRDLFKTSSFKEYLSGALERRGLLAADGGAYLVEADIKKAQTPSFIFNKATVSSEVIYQLVEKETGEVVFRDSVEAVGEASFSDSLIQPTRIGLAIGYAQAESVKVFVNALVDNFHPDLESGPDGAAPEPAPVSDQGEPSAAEETGS